MTLPRQVLPGRFYLVTRRCFQRQCLLRPDPITNNAFEYALGIATADNDIDVLGFTMMSNHHHLVIFDRYGNYPAFLAQFHGLVARMMNTRWQRRDHFWSAAQTSVVWLPDLASVIDKLAYTITNPVKHGLVAKFQEWPGANGYRAMRTEQTIRATRPAFFFSAMATTMAAESEVRVTLPRELGDRAAFLARLDKAIGERLELVKRTRGNKRPLGAHKVLRQHWTHIPPDEQPFTKANRNKLSPTFASKDPEVRKVVVAMRRAFLREYHEARHRWLRHKRCEFPVGTYWLGRHARARVPEALIGPVVWLK